MKPIGGYFELELPGGSKDFPHAHCPALNSGRHALEYILRQLGKEVRMIHLPYYTCDVVLEPLNRLNLPYQFYHINDKLEIDDIPKLEEGHYIIANNYFGIKDEYISNLYNELGSKLIVDNAQAFFAEESLGMKSFYSPRKFVGIPDGGFACTRKNIELDIPQDFSTDRSSHLLRRIDSGPSSGYQEFKDNSHQLSKDPMKRMSNLSYRLLESIDFDEVKYHRRRNFEILHKSLGSLNKLEIPDMGTFSCPMVYPFWSRNTSLREHLIGNNIFVATYWPNVMEWCTPEMIEYSLAKTMLPLPIDQRYGKEEMDYILSILH